MKQDWKVQINEKPGMFMIDIFVYRDTYQGTEVVNGDCITVLGKGEPATPTLSLLPEQLQALVDSLNEKGFKPKEGFLEGKLQATESHLKDMRTLLKLK